MVYDEVYHIALTKQEYSQLHRLIQAGSRLAHLYLGANPICTEYFEWHQYLGELYPKLIGVKEPLVSKNTDTSINTDILISTHPSMQ